MPRHISQRALRTYCGIVSLESTYIGVYCTCGEYPHIVDTRIDCEPCKDAFILEICHQPFSSGAPWTSVDAIHTHERFRAARLYEWRGVARHTRTHLARSGRKGPSATIVWGVGDAEDFDRPTSTVRPERLRALASGYSRFAGSSCQRWMPTTPDRMM